MFEIVFAIVLAVGIFSGKPGPQGPLPQVAQQAAQKQEVVVLEEQLSVISEKEVSLPVAVEAVVEKEGGLEELSHGDQAAVPGVIEEAPVVQVQDLPREEPVIRKIVAPRKKQAAVISRPHPEPVLGEALSTSPKNMEKEVYVAHFDNFTSALNGSLGSRVIVVKQGALNPSQLTFAGGNEPVVCRSDKNGRSDGFCVAEKFVVSDLGESMGIIDVGDFPNFEAALTGREAEHPRKIPRESFNPLQKTARSAEMEATCILGKDGRAKGVCVAKEFVVADASPRAADTR